MLNGWPEWALSLLFTAVGYVAGSFLSAIALPRWFLHKDVTQNTKDGNPGAGYVRIAFVAEPSLALEAAERIAQFVKMR